LLQPIVPTVESGACYLRRGRAWAVDVVEEFAGFLGAAKHDDIVDASSYALVSLNAASAVERLAALGKIHSDPKPRPASRLLPSTVEGWAEL
jgi:hypothetical protein